MKTLKATGSTVVLIPDEGRTITDSGIHLGREVSYPTGQIVSLGPEAQRLLPELEVGAKVVYKRMLLSSMTLDGVDLEVVDVADNCPHCSKTIHKSSVLGVVVDDPSTPTEAH